MGNLNHTVQGQSPDTNKPGKQSDKICFHSDKWDLEALLQVRTLTRGRTSEIREGVRIRNTELYSIVRCPHENLHIVYHSEIRTGVC
jgi:hypothetical protein